MFNLYKKARVLGQGSHSTIFYAIDPENRENVAIKEVELSRLTRSQVVRFSNQRFLHSTFSSPYLITNYGNWESIDEGGMPWMSTALELAILGDLGSYLRSRQCRLSNPEILEIFAQIVLGVSYLHRHGMVHCELSAEHILVTDYCRVKLGDFGTSTSMASILSTSSFKPKRMAYLAPEVLTGRNSLSVATDNWALGCILFLLVSGRLPYRGHNVNLIAQSIYRKGPIDIMALGANIGMQRLIRELLAFNPYRRQSLQHIINQSETLSYYVQVVNQKYGV